MRTKRFTGQVPLQEHETFSKNTSCRLLKIIWTSCRLLQNFRFRALQQNVFHCSNFFTFSRIALQQIFAAEQHSVLQHVVVCCSVLQFYLRNESFRVTEGLLLYRLLQCVAVRCSMLQCVAVCRNTQDINHSKWQKGFCYVLGCSLLQCVALCCSVSQCVAVRCNALQCVAIPKTSAILCGRRASALSYIAACCSLLQYAVRCSALQCVAISKTSIIPSDRRASALSYVAACCSVLHYVAVCCSALQCAAVRCNT